MWQWAKRQCQLIPQNMWWQHLTHQWIQSSLIRFKQQIWILPFNFSVGSCSPWWFWLSKCQRPILCACLKAGDKTKFLAIFFRNTLERKKWIMMAEAHPACFERKHPGWQWAEIYPSSLSRSLGMNLKAVRIIKRKTHQVISASRYCFISRRW